MLRRRHYGQLFLQLILAVAIIGFVGVALHNAVTNLRAQKIVSGFAFLQRVSGFNVIQTLIPYDETATYGRAFLVGLVNTLLVSFLSILLATPLGFFIGILRLSSHWLVQKLATFYVEAVRSVPLLLQIFIWYFGVLRQLPLPEHSYTVGRWLVVNIRGIYIPSIVCNGGCAMEWPTLGTFNYEGGISFIPELIALVLALSTYTAGFIAETVRAGIQSVAKGQREAALSLGLTPRQTMRLVIMPQAWRLIAPPLTSQFLNIVKNSTLAAAIGYPDLVAVFAGTVLLQTGQAVEIIVITMAVYLTISAIIAVLMNKYQQRGMWHER